MSGRTMYEEALKKLYAKVVTKIDRMTAMAHCGEKIDRSNYNILHQAKHQTQILIGGIV